MEFFKKIIELIDTNLILCMIPIILTLIFIEWIFKNQFETKKVLNLMRWTMVIYTLVTFAFYLIDLTTHPNEYTYINRATGPYAMTYWIMLLAALILPLTLFVKKLASKFWYVLLVAFGMKSGMYFERFVIIVTSFHRDYLSENALGSISLSLFGMVFLQGVLITLLSLGVFEIRKKYRL